MAGVAAGVCAFTSIVSVENAWRNAVTAFFAPMDLQTVRVEIPPGGNWRERGFAKPAFDATDLEAVLHACPAVESATLVEQYENADIGVGVNRPEINSSLFAVEADFTDTLADELREGRLFTAQESAEKAPVCVLSSATSRSLFGTRKAVGEQVLIVGVGGSGYGIFEVVGTTAGNRHVGIDSQAIYIPASWTRKLLGRNEGQDRSRTTRIFARAEDPKQALSQIEELMQQRIGGHGARRFARSLWEVREAALNARARATLYSGLAALCALLAAGIGIASILFVSVVESEREIGIRRALGACKSYIYGEYLLCSLLLSAGGCLVGVLAAIPATAAGAFASRWQPVLSLAGGTPLIVQGREFPELSKMTLSVSWEAIAVAFILTLIIGVAAAVAPASEAAGIEPALAIAQRTGTRARLRKLLTGSQVGFAVLVLVVLTSYFSVLERVETAEARDLLGQDKITATADPIRALRKPIDSNYCDRCREAFADVLTSPQRLAELREKTPLLTSLCPTVYGTASVSWGGRVVEEVDLFYTSPEAFRYDPQLAPEELARVASAFSSGSATVVINAEIKDRLFGGRKALGEKVTVAGKPFIVVAVRPLPPDSSGFRNAWLPVSFYTTMKHRTAIPGADIRLEGRPLDLRRYSEAIAQLRDALLPMLPQEYRKGIAFSEDIPETTKQFIFQQKAVAARGAVGALAILLVALIGLANMLLVSVHQEMRETGVRRAFGAQQADVALHFLSEGVLLSAAGSAGGLLIGGLVCWAMRTWVGLPLFVSVFWAVAGAVATVLAGTLISVFPAAAAARIHPVEALRY
jgi:putative ABC transport system permease protein